MTSARVPLVLASASPARLATLRAAGIQTEPGLMADRVEALNATWNHVLRTGRPWVTWKFAGTLDGRSAAADGSSPVILIGVSGSGQLDLPAYAEYLSGDMPDA